MSIALLPKADERRSQYGLPCGRVYQKTSCGLPQVLGVASPRRSLILRRGCRVGHRVRVVRKRRSGGRPFPTEFLRAIDVIPCVVDQEVLVVVCVLRRSAIVRIANVDDELGWWVEGRGGAGKRKRGKRRVPPKMWSSRRSAHVRRGGVGEVESAHQTWRLAADLGDRVHHTKRPGLHPAHDVVAAGTRHL